MCTSHTSPTHGIVIGFQNMLLSTDLHDETVDRDRKHCEQNEYFLHKEEKYTKLTVASFEGMAAPRPNEEFDKVCRAVQQAGGDKLKIFLLGHGLADREFIFSETYMVAEDDPAKKRTIPQLATLVKEIVGQRCGNALEAGNTRVVMLSCVFGRSLTGDLKGSNAWKLHEQKNINHEYLRNAVNTYMSLVEIRRKHNDHEYLYQLLCYLAGRLPEKPLPDGYHPVQAVSSYSPLMGGFYEGHNQASAAKMPRELSDDLIRPIKHRKGGPHVLDPNTKSFLKGLSSDYPKEAKH